MKNPKLSDKPESNTRKAPDQWASGDDPMTGAQASYVATLSEQVHQEVPKKELNKAEASKLIDALKHEAGLGK